MENPNLINIYCFAQLVFENLQNYINGEMIQILSQFLCDLYVDNTATSFILASQTLAFYRVCKRVLLKKWFQLRKWKSNDFNLQKNIMDKEIDNSDFISNPFTDDATYA